MGGVWVGVTIPSLEVSILNLILSRLLLKCPAKLQLPAEHSALASLNIVLLECPTPNSVLPILHLRYECSALPILNLQYVHGSKPMLPFWDRCTTHFRTFFSGDRDVHWGYDLGFDPRPY